MHQTKTGYIFQDWLYILHKLRRIPEVLADTTHTQRKKQDRRDSTGVTRKRSPGSYWSCVQCLYVPMTSATTPLQVRCVATTMHFCFIAEKKMHMDEKAWRPTGSPWNLLKWIEARGSTLKGVVGTGVQNKRKTKRNFYTPRYWLHIIHFNMFTMLLNIYIHFFAGIRIIVYCVCTSVMERIGHLLVIYYISVTWLYYAWRHG